MQEAFRVLYRSGLSTASALVRLRAEMGASPLVMRLADFVAASRLGIVPPGLREDGVEEPEREETVR